MDHGSFYVFGEKLESTLRLPVRSRFVRNADFHFDGLFLKIHHCEFRNKALALVLGEGVYVLRLPLWQYGGLDSASSANRVQMV